MIAKRTGWPSVRRNIGAYRLATQSRPAPARTTSTPMTPPRASTPPPPATATTIIASPSTSIAADRTCVAARWTVRGAARSALRGAPIAQRLRAAAGRRHRRPTRRMRRAVLAGAVGVDDHARRALGEHGLDGLAEQRAAGPRGQRDDDRLRAHVAGLVDDHAPGLPRADLLV